MSYTRRCIGASLVVTGLLAGGADAAIMITGHTADATLEEQEGSGGDDTVGPAIVVRETNSTILVGVTGFPGGDNLARWDQSAIFVFQLPAQPVGGVTDASFAFTLDSTTTGGSRPNRNADLYGLPYQSSSVIDPDWHYSGDYDADTTTGATAIQESILLNPVSEDPSTPLGRVTTDDSGNAALAAFIQAQYDAGAQEGDFIFLRINSNTDFSASTTNVARSYRLASADHEDPELRPVLTIVPEPTMLGLLGVIPVMMLRRRRR